MDKVNASVMFRKCNVEPFVGDVIAFFAEDYRRGSVVCYEHIGQHGTAAIEYMTDCTVEASPAEYAALKTELENIVGYNLTILDYDAFIDTLRNGRY